MEKRFENVNFKAVVSRFKRKSTGKIFFKVQTNIYELLNDKKYEEMKDHLNHYTFSNGIVIRGKFVEGFDEDEKWFRLIFDYINLHYVNLEKGRKESKRKGKIIRKWLSK